VLLVEDHPALREMMHGHLGLSGFAADAVGRGDEAIAAISAVPYDAVVLDLGLPDMDGLMVLHSLRSSAAPDVPVLILTARDALSDRVGGLDAGADDYLLKPFDLEEFDARLRSILRRTGTRREPILRLGHLAFDTEAREARIGVFVLDLTRREISLLEALACAGGRTIVRDALEDRLYGLSEPVSGNALEAVVSRLRRRLAFGADGTGSGLVIETVRGIGYRLVVREGIPAS